jgi:hypothetical protein
VRGEHTPLVKQTSMDLFEWHAHLANDPRFRVVRRATRDGRCWIYVECLSAPAATTLLTDLQRGGHLMVARRNPVSIWLEEERE